MCQCNNTRDVRVSGTSYMYGWIDRRVSVYLNNGIHLRGTLKKVLSDSLVMLANDGVEMVVFAHSIATTKPEE